MATTSKHLLLAACGAQPGMLALELDGTDGSLQQVGSCPEIAGTNFVIPSPKGRGAWLLYDEPGVTDRPSGAVSLLRPDRKGLWIQTHRLATSGSTPCFGSVMPDSRRNRGPGPEDEVLFSPENVQRMRQAVAELSWLLTRGYPPRWNLI